MSVHRLRYLQMQLTPIRALWALFHCWPLPLTSISKSTTKVSSDEADGQHVKNSDAEASGDGPGLGSILLDTSPEHTAKIYCFPTDEKVLMADKSSRPVWESVSAPGYKSLVAECRQEFYKVYLRSVHCAGGAMAHQASLVHNAVRHSSAGSVCFVRYFIFFAVNCSEILVTVPFPNFEILLPLCLHRLEKT